jgi:hypothetical protein
MGKICCSGTLRNQLQLAVRCHLIICTEGMKRTGVNMRILALAQELNLKYQLGLPFPNFDVVFMNSIVIHVVIKIE